MRRFTPALDGLESRIAPSTVSVSTPAYRQARAGIVQAVAAFDRSGDLARATRALTRAAVRIPLARQNLVRVWRAQLSTPDSARAAAREILLSLDVHLHRGAEARAFAVKGPAAARVSRPEVHALDGATAFVNLTREALEVAVSRRGGEGLQAYRLEAGSTLYAKLPPGPLEIDAAIGGAEPGRFGAEDLADDTVTFSPGPGPGTIIARVYRDGF